MHEFYFSLWVFDPNFLPSVVIMVTSLFIISTVFTKIITGAKVHRIVNGPDPSEARETAYRKLLMTSMHEELDAVSAGKKYRDLDDSEKEAMRDIRKQYFEQLKEDQYGSSKQLKS